MGLEIGIGRLKMKVKRRREEAKHIPSYSYVILIWFGSGLFLRVHLAKKLWSFAYKR
jgi:hypothetical protein